MEQGFRASMNWLHTWSGVVLGGLLFAIFWMGTLVGVRPRDRPLDGADDPASGGGEDVLARGAAPAVRGRGGREVADLQRRVADRSRCRDAGLVAGPVGPRPSLHRSRHRRGAARPRDAGRHALHLSVSLHAAHPHPEHRLLAGRIGRHGDDGAVRLRRDHPSQDLHRLLHLPPRQEAAPPDPRPAQRHRRAGPAVPFPDQPVGAGHLLGDLFPELLAGHLQRRPAGVLRRRLRQRHPEEDGRARRHGLVRRHGRRGAAPVGRLGAALRLRPQSRRCKVGRCRSAASTRASSAAPTTRPISTGRPAR